MAFNPLHTALYCNGPSTEPPHIKRCNTPLCQLSGVCTATLQSHACQGLLHGAELPGGALHAGTQLRAAV